ncbi:DUF262 domain-containing protein [Variovorax paradoxus]|uniref:DUF262 domain-containing protein n=1 Tax=Variovorax paradoxus TaxID=34073 RepID=A0A5Q0MC04_VARPD|nr:DUF262 domain-containing protein [Variovorax paradoxus]QFZ87161.1 DUF262 domain-containing protein [Variovorax paradoxus]
MATAKTNREIEGRYAQEDKEIAQERSDFLLPQVIDFVQKKQWMNLQPEYQRRQVWDKRRQSEFIESLLMNLPIPPVFLFEPEYSRYEVMDGQQRLSSIISFYGNRLKLVGLEHWKELNGKIYSDLPTKVQRGLDRRRISAVVLQSMADPSSANELRQIVFERLNTGGQKLNAQELRNCVYSGRFSTLLVELAGLPQFNDLIGVPRYEDHFVDGQVSPALESNPLFKRMIDCEIVLRFFALRNPKDIKGSMKSILDKCMERNRNINEDQALEMTVEFRSRVELAHELFGENAFKAALDPEEKVSQPFYDAVIIACDRVYTSRQRLLRNKAKLKRSVHATFGNEENYGLLVGRGNTAKTIQERLNLVESIFRDVL